MTVEQANQLQTIYDKTIANEKVILVCNLQRYETSSADYIRISYNLKIGDREFTDYFQQGPNWQGSHNLNFTY